MPAKSIAQQKFMALVKSAQAGNAKVDGKAKKASKEMSKSDVDDFASTKHDGLPYKVKQETKVRSLIRKMVREMMAEIKEGGPGSGPHPDDDDNPYDREPSDDELKDIEKQFESDILDKEREKQRTDKEKFRDRQFKDMERARDREKRLKKNEGIKETINKIVDKYINMKEAKKVAEPVSSVPSKPTPSKPTPSKPTPSKPKPVVGKPVSKTPSEKSTTSKGKSSSKSKKGTTSKAVGKVDKYYVKKKKKDDEKVKNEGILLEIQSMKEFYKYFIKFYGPKGLYPNKKGKLKLSDINKAVSVYLAKNPNREFYGDSPDREAVRDVLIKQKKLVPDYGTNEGFAGGLKKEDQKNFEKNRKSQAEVLGYTLTGKEDTKVDIGKLTEDKFIAFYKKDRVIVNAKSLWDAKKQIIAKLKVPKKDVGLVSVLNKTEYDKQKFRFEGKVTEGGEFDIKKMTIDIYDGAAQRALTMVRNKVMSKYKVGKKSPVSSEKVTRRLVATLINNGMKELRNKTKEPGLKKAFEKIIKTREAMLKTMKEGKLTEKKMDRRKAAEILKQIGGNRFIAMTGAKGFAFSDKYMSFKIGRNSKGINFVRIGHNAKDLYDMQFGFVSTKGIKVKKKVKDVYADMLGQIFKKHTGMNVRL